MRTDRDVYADKDSAVLRLRRNGVQVAEVGKVVLVPKTMGIKLWGAVDYLKRFHGFEWGRAVR